MPSGPKSIYLYARTRAGVREGGTGGGRGVESLQRPILGLPGGQIRLCGPDWLRQLVLKVLSEAPESILRASGARA